MATGTGENFSNLNSLDWEMLLSASKGLGAAAAVTLVGKTLFSQSAQASEDQLHPPALPWSHKNLWQTYDHASIRRGFFVYKSVCANCHSINAVAYRHLINNCLTADESKAMAEDAEVEDGPNDEGEMYSRPGKITDFLPKPYPNDQAARFANGGSLPPDLSCIIKARPNGANYIYNLLTGYRDPPAGIEIRSGQYYNPYFPGGALSMAQALQNDLVDYEDGTPTTISQLAKDVTTFLCWVSEPELDERHRYGVKALLLVAATLIPTFFLKRAKWSVIKTRKIRFYDS